MTIYNKTKKTIVYPGGENDVRLPASAEDGVRGAAVVIDGKMKNTLTMNWQRVLADSQAQKIEIEP